MAGRRGRSVSLTAGGWTLLHSDRAGEGPVPPLCSACVCCAGSSLRPKYRDGERITTVSPCATCGDVVRVAPVATAVTMSVTIDVDISCVCLGTTSRRAPDRAGQGPFVVE